MASEILKQMAMFLSISYILKLRSIASRFQIFYYFLVYVLWYVHAF